MALPEDDAIARSEMLLRESEEDLARERMQQFWRDWGATLIGMALMLVLGTGAGVAWREWQQHRNEASTAQLSNMLAQNPMAFTLEDTDNLNNTHAGIAWMARAGTLKSDDMKALANTYANAEKASDDNTWGWLARWNTLRLRMDDETTDTKKLLSDFEHLAKEESKSPLMSLAYTDAAVVAGERLKNPKAALAYLEKAEQLAGSINPMALTISDLKHLYEIRAQADNKKEESQ